MIKFIELQTLTYRGKDYNKYIKSIAKDPEDLPEGDEWKRDLLDEEEKVPIPKGFKSAVLIDPTKILSIVQTFSPEEMESNPEDPQFDTLEFYLEDGLQLSAFTTLEDFYIKLKEYNEN